jgi:hypothetical protein
MSALRARCPDCRTLTAVAIGPEYQCHACGREFGAGLVRVPAAWGVGGEGMAEAARLPLPWPEAAVVEEPSLTDQFETQGRTMPARPLVLGGCCCAQTGAIRALARRGRLGVVWLDAHGGLNTPESSPSGNAWGMSLRMLLDAGDVAPEDVTLLGVRHLDPPEADYLRPSGIRTELGELPERVYVAVDLDVLRPEDADVRYPVPDGLPVTELEQLLAAIPAPVGAGFSGLLASERNAVTVTRLARSLGL